MEALASVATIAQLVSFTGEILAAGYSYLNKVKKAPLEIKALLREISQINTLLDQLQDLASDGDSSNILGALEILDKMGVFEDTKALMAAVDKSIKTCQQIEGQAVKNAGKRFMWPFKEKETKDMIMQLARLRDTLNSAVVVDSAKTLKQLKVTARDIDANVIMILNTMFQLEEGMTAVTIDSSTAAANIAYVKSTISAKIHEDERAEIRKWLYPDIASSDSALNFALNMRHPDTGNWFLESKEFETWKGLEEASLWVYGIAGSGKTILSATVVEYLRKNPISSSSVVLYFFCDRRDPTKQTFQDLIHVIIKKLIEEDSTCLEEAKIWRDSKSSKQTGQTSLAATLNTAESASLIRKLCQKWDYVSLVVDAIDECASVESFTEGLKCLTQGSNINLLLTSRDEVETRLTISPLAKIQMSLPERMRNDIYNFLIREVYNRITRKSLKIKTKGLDSEIVTALAKKADGMILIAKLQLDYICNLKSDRAIKEALATLPKDIYATYDEILQQLCLKRPNDVVEIRQILQWLAYCKVPLTLGQLAEAISIRPGDRYLDETGIATDVLDLAACCGSLVTVQSQDTGGSENTRGMTPQKSVIILSHASVYEYLKSRKIEPLLAEKFPMGSESVNLALAETCLQYIGFQDFEGAIKRELVNESKAVDDEKLTQNQLELDQYNLQRRMSRYAFYNYASLYWADHLRSCLPMFLDNEDTIHLLDWFLDSCNHPGEYASWQQMYHQDVKYYCPGRQPICYAIDFQLDDLMRLLLPPDNQLNDLIVGQTLLQIAASSGSLNTIEELIRRGAIVDQIGSYRIAKYAKTPLRIATENGHYDAVKLLIQHGASIYSRSKSGSVVFYGAARSGSLPTLKILYDAGPGIDDWTWDGWTPLFECVAHGKLVNACQLLHWGADPTITTNRGDSVLSILRRHHNEKFEDDTDDHEYDTIEPTSKSFGGSLVTNSDILSEIERLREMKGGPERFEPLFKGYEARYVFLDIIGSDTRPGNERMKDQRWSEDPSYLIRRSQSNNK